MIIPDFESIYRFERDEPGGDEWQYNCADGEAPGKNVPGLFIEHIRKSWNTIIHFVYNAEGGLIFALSLGRHFGFLVYLNLLVCITVFLNEPQIGTKPQPYVQKDFL